MPFIVVRAQKLPPSLAIRCLTDDWRFTRRERDHVRIDVVGVYIEITRVPGRLQALKDCADSRFIGGRVGYLGSWLASCWDDESYDYKPYASHDNLLRQSGGGSDPGQNPSGPSCAQEKSKVTGVGWGLVGAPSTTSTATPCPRRTRASRRRRWRRLRLGLSPHRVTAASGVGRSRYSIILDDGRVRFGFRIGARICALFKSKDFLKEPLPTSPNAPRDRALSLPGAPFSDVRRESRPEGVPLWHVRRALV